MTFIVARVCPRHQVLQVLKTVVVALHHIEKLSGSLEVLLHDLLFLLDAVIVLLGGVKELSDCTAIFLQDVL